MATASSVSHVSFGSAPPSSSSASTGWSSGGAPSSSSTSSGFNSQFQGFQTKPSALAIPGVSPGVAKLESTVGQASSFSFAGFGTGPTSSNSAPGEFGAAFGSKFGAVGAAAPEFGNFAVNIQLKQIRSALASAAASDTARVALWRSVDTLAGVEKLAELQCHADPAVRAKALELETLFNPVLQPMAVY